MPRASSLLINRLLSTANGNAGRATRHVSSKKILVGVRGMAYRKLGTSPEALRAGGPFRWIPPWWTRATVKILVVQGCPRAQSIRCDYTTCQSILRACAATLYTVPFPPCYATPLHTVLVLGGVQTLRYYAIVGILQCCIPCKWVEKASV